MPRHDDYDDRRDDDYDDLRDDPDRDRRDDGDHDDYDRPEGRRRGGVVRRARDKVSVPAMILLIIALLCLAWNVMAITLYWAAPDTIIQSKYDMMKQLFPNQPLPAYEDYVKQEQTQQTVIYALRAVVSVIIAIGAMKMRSLQAYPFAMTASVLSIIPLCANECCCTLPFGIWALVVLLNADVKQGFYLTARAGGY